MKRILRSKLALTLAAFLMVAAAIVIPLSGSISGSHAQSTLVTFAKSATPTVAPSGTINYTLTLTNITPSGSGTLHDIHLNDTPPVQTSGTFTAPTFTITPPGSATVDCALSTTTSISCAVDDFAPGSVVTVSFSTTASSTATGTITNTATATTFSGNINETATANTTITVAKHQRLFVVLQGINTNLSASDVAANNGYGVINDFETTVFEGPRGSIRVPGIVPYLKAHGFGNAQFMAYSYAGSDGKGHPSAYACASTFTQPLVTDVKRLGKQIIAALTNNPALKGKPTDVYLIGHSLGGVVAFSYLTALYHTTGVVSALPTGDSLKSVITLDSPIGGVSDDPRYFDAIATGVKYFTSCGVEKSDLVSVKNLITIFKTTSKPTFPPPDDDVADPQGSHASILEGILGGMALTNQGVAEDAASAHGTSILTIGNTSDILWQLGVCTLPRINFISTQWVEDEAGEVAVYGREFTDGNVTCANLTTNQANHKEVYHLTAVEHALSQFLPNGGEPVALTIAPPGP